ncbi:uncharacterized protein LOC104890604 [Beta vulgaris subsp. vulgaris]|uniref:uncharacterized protein LOC104890604 n=1 Tax=Beta vulgaris subsp. vulgaris TaxID=3555 RepID=UPI002036D050|nr:uncharacterized protein LOC104890604 [Beta vulgaris subsp. vulgaris]
MTEISIMRIDRKSSIETEPKTLNFQQVQSARDAALYVVKSKTREEAKQIFTEGMAPMATAGSDDTTTTGTSEYEDEEETYPTYTRRQYGLEALREVFTAPF